MTVPVSPFTPPTLFFEFPFTSGLFPAFRVVIDLVVFVVVDAATSGSLRVVCDPLENPETNSSFFHARPLDSLSNRSPLARRRSTRLSALLPATGWETIPGKRDRLRLSVKRDWPCLSRVSRGGGTIPFHGNGHRRNNACLNAFLESGRLSR